MREKGKKKSYWKRLSESFVKRKSHKFLNPLGKIRKNFPVTYVSGYLGNVTQRNIINFSCGFRTHKVYKRNIYLGVPENILLCLELTSELNKQPSPKTN